MDTSHGIPTVLFPNLPDDVAKAIAGWQQHRGVHGPGALAIRLAFARDAQSALGLDGSGFRKVGGMLGIEGFVRRKQHALELARQCGLDADTVARAGRDVRSFQRIAMWHASQAFPETQDALRKSVDILSLFGRRGPGLHEQYAAAAQIVARHADEALLAVPTVFVDEDAGHVSAHFLEGLRSSGEPCSSAKDRPPQLFVDGAWSAAIAAAGGILPVGEDVTFSCGALVIDQGPAENDPRSLAALAIASTMWPNALQLFALTHEIEATMAAPKSPFLAANGIGADVSVRIRLGASRPFIDGALPTISYERIARRPPSAIRIRFIPAC